MPRNPRWNAMPFCRVDLERPPVRLFHKVSLDESAVLSVRTVRPVILTPTPRTPCNPDFLQLFVPSHSPNALLNS
jgi:hypothetical protein